MLKTRVIIVLDRSGSMESIKKEAVQMLNQQLKTIRSRANEMDTKVSLVTFASHTDAPVLWNRDAREVADLSDNDYKPNGGTALYDAVGSTIDKLLLTQEYLDPDCSFLMVIISDGEENSSLKFNASDVAEKITALQNSKRWTFTYLGANQDLSKVTEKLNIPTGNTQMWTFSSAGIIGASQNVACSTDGFLRGRSSGMTAMSNFYSGPDLAEGRTSSSSGPSSEQKPVLKDGTA